MLFKYLLKESICKYGCYNRLKYDLEKSMIEITTQLAKKTIAQQFPECIIFSGERALMYIVSGLRSA